MRERIISLTIAGLLGAAVVWALMKQAERIPNIARCGKEVCEED